MFFRKGHVWMFCFVLLKFTNFVLKKMFNVFLNFYICLTCFPELFYLFCNMFFRNMFLGIKIIILKALQFENYLYQNITVKTTTISNLNN
ncbi:unnamed protein product [Meloidogyne enterolobii]|uniref:Uncharacterized protein n=1 Tax=Meloidogyne enterolobii TaxID=390850 RepID=A0ACB0ZC56_MELEN